MAVLMVARHVLGGMIALPGPLIATDEVIDMSVAF